LLGGFFPRERPLGVAGREKNGSPGGREDVETTEGAGGGGPLRHTAHFEGLTGFQGERKKRERGKGNNPLEGGGKRCSGPE